MNTEVRIEGAGAELHRRKDRYLRTLIASDWHLGSFSSPAAAGLAQLFLERGRAAGDRVVLNGDIFEGLFEPAESAEAAQPAVRDLITEMTSREQLLRVAGNHDPDAGSLAMVLDQASVGRVLIAHGHAVDPLYHSPLGQLGDAVSRRVGHLAVVRGAASFAEHAANAVAGIAIEHAFQARCRAMVQHNDCVLGIFGHVHRRYLVPGDAYVNTGHLARERLEYLVLTDDVIQLAHLDLRERQIRESSRISAESQASAAEQ